MALHSLTCCRRVSAIDDTIKHVGYLAAFDVQVFTNDGNFKVRFPSHQPSCTEEEIRIANDTYPSVMPVSEMRESASRLSCLQLPLSL